MTWVLIHTDMMYRYRSKLYCVARVDSGKEYNLFSLSSSQHVYVIPVDANSQNR